MLPISRKCWEDKKTQVLVALSEKGHLTVNSTDSTTLRFVSESIAYTRAVLLIPPRPLSRLPGSDQIPETLHVGHTQASPCSRRTGAGLGRQHLAGGGGSRLPTPSSHSPSRTSGSNSRSPPQSPPQPRVDFCSVKAGKLGGLPHSNSFKNSLLLCTARKEYLTSKKWVSEQK